MSTGYKYTIPGCTGVRPHEGTYPSAREPIKISFLPPPPPPSPSLASGQKLVIRERHVLHHPVTGLGTTVSRRPVSYSFIEFNTDRFSGIPDGLEKKLNSLYETSLPIPGYGYPRKADTLRTSVLFFTVTENLFQPQPPPPNPNRGLSKL